MLRRCTQQLMVAVRHYHQRGLVFNSQTRSSANGGGSCNSSRSSNIRQAASTSASTSTLGPASTSGGGDDGSEEGGTNSVSVAVGDVFTTTRTFGEDDVTTFVKLTGDTNPIHVAGTQRRDNLVRGDNGTGTGNAMFKNHNDANTCAVVVPGLLTASLFPGVVGSALPGALYLRQTLSFRQPLFAGDEVTVEVVVTKLSGRKLTLSTKASVVNNTCGQRRSIGAAEGKRSIVVDGDALALLPK